jgi:hypothetical protein
MSIQAIPARTRIIDHANMPRFRVQPLAKPVDFDLCRTNLAEQFHFAQAYRVGNRNRILVNVQSTYNVSSSVLASVLETNHLVAAAPH